MSNFYIEEIPKNTLPRNNCKIFPSVKSSIITSKNFENVGGKFDHHFCIETFVKFNRNGCDYLIPLIKKKILLLF